MRSTLAWRTPSIVVFLVLMALGSMSACSGAGATVEEITIVNGTPYDLIVDVSGTDRDSWLPVATVEAGSSAVPRQVMDQGEVWLFRFRHWGEPVGEATFDRAELESNGWRVEVPGEISDRLEELGRPPS